MSIPQRPQITRLRWVRARNPETLEQFLRDLGARVQIYQIVFQGGKWYLWFVPDDFKMDVRSGDLDR